MDDLARTRSIARGIPKEKVQKKLLGAIPTCSFDKVLSHNGPPCIIHLAEADDSSLQSHTTRRVFSLYSMKI